MQIDSYGLLRGTVDTNQRVNERIALRLNGLVQRGERWHENSDDNHYAGDLALLFRFSDRTQLRVEGEVGHVQRKMYSTNFFDQASFWNRTTSYNGVTPIANPDAAGVSRFGGSDPYFVWIPGVPQAGWSNWAPFYRTNGTGVALQTDVRTDVPNVGVLPRREFNLGPPDTDTSVKYRSLTAWLEQRITERLDAQISAYRFEDDRAAANTELFNAYQIDVNQVLPTGAANPKFGVPFAEAGTSRQHQDRSVDELRAALTYRFDLDWANLTQRFSLIGGARRETFEVATYNLRRTGGPNQNPNLNAAENIVRYRLYWDEPLKYPLGELPSAAGHTFGFVPNGWFYEERKDLTYGQLASNTTLWDERVSIVLGIRNDHVERRQQNPVYSNGPTVLGPATFDSASAVTTSAGAVVYPIKQVGAFFNYSENFAPVTAGPNRLDGTPFGPTRGRGVDYGIKLNLLEGMVYATLSRYSSEQSGRITSDPKIGIVRGIWRNFGATSPALTTIDYRDTEALKAEGYEFEIVANPTNNLRISAGIAFPETETVDLLPGLKQYYAQNIGAWQAALANGTATNPTALASELNNLQQALASAEKGTQLNGTYKYTANIYATYAFTDGPLDGWAFGAGAWGRGRQKIGSADPRILFRTETPTDEQRRAAAFDYLYAREYYSLSAHVSYERAFGRKMRAKFQINVDNLLDDDEPIYLSYNVYRPGGVQSAPLAQARGYYNFVDPRKITFSATLSF